MNVTTMIIIGVILLGVGAFFAFNYYKKRNLEQLYTQVYETSRQVPKQKKKAFLLLMFKETMAASMKKSKKSKSPTTAGMLNNPKYLEIQMMQMTKILKDTSNVKDKTIKRSLVLLENYQKWEDKKHADAKLASQEKKAPVDKK